eukprot:COSAG01_NODE_28438_length_661_cov_0.859431_1_plen_178_part_10
MCQLSGARVAVQELQVVGAQVARERARGVQLVRGSSSDGYEPYDCGYQCGYHYGPAHTSVLSVLRSPRRSAGYACTQEEQLAEERSKGLAQLARIDELEAAAKQQREQADATLARVRTMAQQQRCATQLCPTPCWPTPFSPTGAGAARASVPARHRASRWSGRECTVHWRHARMIIVP